VVECLVDAGYQWLFLDMEHGAFDYAVAADLLRAAGPIPCLIRLPAQGDVYVKKALDIGAAGIIVPLVNTAAEAAQAVRSAKYSPLGARGVGIARAHRYGYGFADYLARANDETVVMVQAEHIEAVRNIAEIVRVPGVDGIFVGPYDLSASMGRMGQVGAPEVRAEIERVRQAALGAGLRLGYFGVSAEAVLPAVAEGYTLLAVGSDTLFLSGAASACRRLFPAAAAQ